MSLPQGETLKGYADPLDLDGEGLAGIVRRAVVQATSKDARAGIIIDALLRAEVDNVPVSAGPLTAFVLGPLFDAVLHAVDMEAARRTVKILKPFLRRRSELELGDASPPQMEGAARKKTVLIVDRDIVVRAQLLSILTEAGYEAISASDSNVALAMSVRCRPDLIISDLNIGKAHGRQLATLLRVAFNEDAPPIVILTDDVSWHEEGEGVCVLAKPIDRVTLLAAAQRLSMAPPAEAD
jgi:two-component system chemotaxis response regulator CheY